MTNLGAINSNEDTEVCEIRELDRFSSFISSRCGETKEEITRANRLIIIKKRIAEMKQKIMEFENLANCDQRYLLYLKEQHRFLLGQYTNILEQIIILNC